MMAGGFLYKNPKNRYALHIFSPSPPPDMYMNVTQLARRLRVPTKELLEKLPELGISVGRKAIKINDKEAYRIQKAWAEMKRKEAVQKKHKEQQEREERRNRRFNRD